MPRGLRQWPACSKTPARCLRAAKPQCSQAAVVLRALLLLRVRLFLLVPVFPPAPPVLLALNRLRSHPRPRRKRMSRFVEAVSGRVVVFARGKPTLLENADVISAGAQLDLQANSELRICHYTANRLLMLRGPARAVVSAAGVVDEAGRAVPGRRGNMHAVWGFKISGRP